jgi:hypothetical protein
MVRQYGARNMEALLDSKIAGVSAAGAATHVGLLRSLINTASPQNPPRFFVNRAASLGLSFSLL